MKTRTKRRDFRAVRSQLDLSTLSTPGARSVFCSHQGQLDHPRRRQGPDDHGESGSRRRYTSASWQSGDVGSCPTRDAFFATTHFPTTCNVLIIAVRTGGPNWYFQAAKSQHNTSVGDKRSSTPHCTKKTCQRFWICLIACIVAEGSVFVENDS